VRVYAAITEVMSIVGAVFAIVLTAHAVGR
jgi:hypothetical protein